MKSLVKNNNFGLSMFIFSADETDYFRFACNVSLAVCLVAVWLAVRGIGHDDYFNLGSATSNLTVNRSWESYRSYRGANEVMKMCFGRQGMCGRSSLGNCEREETLFG